MKRVLRIAVGSAALVAGLAIAGASAANAQVRFRGSFPLPHGRISVNVGHSFPIGGYVPYGYDVYDDPDYGYGFLYEDQWIACEPRGSRFIIIAAPVFYGGYRNYGYGGYRSYGYRSYPNYGYRDYRYSRPYRNDRHYSRDYRNYRRDDHRRGDRNWGRNDRRDRDHRDGDRRDGRRDGGRNRRWNN